MKKTNCNITLSVILCTYNRAEFLFECLESLVNQTIDCVTFEVIVIDNKSSDHTSAVANSFQVFFPNFKVIFEPTQGLSHARNRGITEASGSWVGFVDDDGKVRRNYIELALEMIEKYNFDCFGGKIVDLIDNRRPKWFKANPYPLPEEKRCDGIIELKQCYIPGGIMFFKKSVFDHIRFDPQLGMHGEDIGYAEESFLQNTIRKRGMTIGFNPKIILDHRTLEIKYSILWQLKSSYSLAYSNSITKQPVSSFKFPFSISGMLFHLILDLFQITTHLIKTKDYYIQNAIIDWLHPFSRKLGRLSAEIKTVLNRS